MGNLLHLSFLACQQELSYLMGKRELSDITYQFRFLFLPFGGALPSRSLKSGFRVPPRRSALLKA